MRDRTDYDALPGISSTHLKDFADHPRLYYQRWVEKSLPPKPVTPAMQFGLDLEAVLWGDGLDVIVIPDEVLNSQGHRKGKAWTEWAAKHEGKRLLKREEWERFMDPLEQCQQSILDNPIASRLIYQVPEEQLWWQIGWKCPCTGVRRKGELDVILRGEVIVDLKTSANTDAEWFSRQCYRMGWYRQLAGYQEGWLTIHGETLRVQVVIVRNVPPHDCQVYQLSDEFLTLGRQHNHRLLEELAECQRTGQWTRPGEGSVIEIDPPRYAKWDEYDVDPMEVQYERE